MIIDAHLHVDDVPALGWSLEAAYCVRRLDEAGIDRGVVMTIVDAPEVNPNAPLPSFVIFSTTMVPRAWLVKVQSATSSELSMSNA